MNDSSQPEAVNVTFDSGEPESKEFLHQNVVPFYSQD